MHRRSVIKLLAAGGAVGASIAAFKGFSGSSLWNKSQSLVSKTRMGMGTYVSVTITDPSSNRAEEAIQTAFARMDKLEAGLTRFDPASPLSHLNSTGRLAAPSPDLLAVLERAHQAHKITNGVFDVTVAPLLALYEKSFAKGHAPAASDIAAASQLVGQGHMSVSPAQVSFQRAGMAVTLDAVAKGYIVDAMIASLKQSGIKHALVNAGGDIRAFGGKSAGQPWKVAVRNPVDPAGQPARTFDLFEGSCATSGNYEVYFDKEKLFHHIINPASGLSPRQYASATVLSDTAAAADALSTSLMLMGRGGLSALSGQAKGLMLIDASGQVLTA